MGTGADSARMSMLDAAERLVAERGLASVSARDVLQAAGQRNKSAIAYHFGSWDDLIAAILTSRMAAVSTRRQAMLDDIDATVRPNHPPTTRQLVEALILPVAEHCVSDPTSRWARFLYRCMADPTVAEIVRRSVEGESFRSASRRLVEHLEHLHHDAGDGMSPHLVQRRVAMAFAIAVTALAELETRRDAERGPDLPVEVILSDLVDTAVAIVERPPSAATIALLDRATANP